MDRFQQYLFERNPEAQLRDWAMRLGRFRFCRACGGHANDGDSLEVVFPYRTPDELEQFLLALDIEVIRYGEKPMQPQPGKPYRGDTLQQFVSLVPDTCWIRQPGRCRIVGEDVFVWCDGKEIRISIGADYIVTEEHALAAEAVEEALADAPLCSKDPPIDSHHCICPKYYPTYFQR
ncbi:MAG: hypothetical protein EOO28_05250 [Comamonadaceae bacterium]|nr:MAG: hypothetical protein EOO28_05250 [Comamonadaceae bacterium]